MNVRGMVIGANLDRYSSIKAMLLISIILVACGNETQTEYYESGSIKTVREMRDGVFDGEYKEYYENGVLKGEGLYKNGKPEGKIVQYSKSGKVELETSYQNGVLHGISRGYYESGNLHYESEFVNSKREGWTTNFFDSHARSVKERKLYNAESRVVYLQTFDDQGTVILNQITPYLKFEKDTIDFNRSINVDLCVDFKVPKTIVYLGLTDERIGLRDTLAVDTIGQGKTLARFSIIVNKVGRVKIGCIFSNSSPNGDSTNLRNVSPSHWIFIGNTGKSI